MKKMTTRRKLAISTWSAPREGNIYGKLTIDATEAVSYIHWLRRKSGEKITITHLVGRAVGDALAKATGLNGYIKLGRYVPHDTVDVAFLVALAEGQDLAQAKVHQIDTKHPSAIAKELRERGEKLRSGKDEAFESSKPLLRILPTWLIRPILAFSGWITSSLGWSFPPAKLKPFPFGSCIITSVGMFGLDEGFAPPTPFARVPVYVLIGAMNERPAVVDGNLAVRTQLTITATVDHRFMDGFQGGVLAQTVRDRLQNPWQWEGLQGPPGDLLAADEKVDAIVADASTGAEG